MKTLRFEEYLKKRLSAEEIQELEVAAEVEAQFYIDLQSQISQAVQEFMTRSELRFNDMVRLLGTSPSQFKKIQSGQANLTLASIAHLFALMKKKPYFLLKELTPSV